MEKQKVLVAERISDKGVACLKAEKTLDVTVDFDIKRENLLRVIGDYDALIVRSVTKVNEELYDAAKNSRWLAGPAMAWIISTLTVPPNGASL